MRVNGKEVSIKPEIVVIPKGQDNFIFKACLVDSYEVFDKLCPKPEVPIKQSAKGKTPMLDNPKYVKEINEWSDKKTAWMIIKSLEATEGLEWSTVDYENPETWDNYSNDLQSGGYSDLEIMTIVSAVLDANGLNQSKIEEATKSFLAGLQAVPEV